MAAAVDPFSFATAELSEDYIRIFPNPDMIPEYLADLCEKTGVVVFAVDKSISVKGSWVSLNRVRSFLTKVVASCQVTESKDDKKDVNQSVVESQPVTEAVRSMEVIVAVESITEELDEFDQKPGSFRDNNNEPSSWINWTEEVLPQIQPVRSKRTSENSQPKSEAKVISEPLVLFANYQPPHDPTATVPATLDAIGKALKKMYDSKQQKSSKSAPTLLTDHVAVNEHTNLKTLQTEDNQSVVSLTNHKQAEISFSVTANASPHKVDESSDRLFAAVSDNSDDQGSQSSVLDSAIISSAGVAVTDTVPSFHKSQPQKDFGDESSDGLFAAVSDNSDDQGSQSSVLDSAIISSAGGAVTDTVPSFHKSQPQKDFGDTNTSQTCSTLTRKQSKGVPQTRRGRKRKNSKQNMDIRDSGQLCNSVTELRNINSFNNAIATQTKDDCVYNSVVQPDIMVKKARREGGPSKNTIYQSETSVSDTSNPTEMYVKCKNVGPMEVVHPTPSSLCSVWEKTGKLQHTITHEEVDVKQQGKGFSCEHCPYTARKMTHLREHKRRVHITKEFKCEECGKIFGIEKDLKRHIHTHQRAENCCDICGKMYKGVRNLAEHKKTHETDYIKPEFPCEFCQKVFSTKYVLGYHIKSEHLGMKKTFICPTCGKSFSQKSSYLQHANVHMGIKPYQCDICGRSFSYEKSLKEHKFMHQDDKQFECEVCHKKFRQSSGIAIHMKIHKDHKDYVCSACGKGFSQKQAMLRHERIHVGEKPFTCILCQRSFTDSSILRRHMILIHKKDKDKWHEDTENNVQHRTDFFISVVSKGEMVEKSQANHHQDAGENVTKKSNRSSVQEMARKSIAEPECFIDYNPTCDAGNCTPAGGDTVTSMSQKPSSSDLPLTVVTSGVVNAYSFTEPNTCSSSLMCSGHLQANSDKATQLPVYTEVDTGGSGNYNPRMMMSNALASLPLHSGAISDEQAVECQDLMTDPFVLQ